MPTPIKWGSEFLINTTTASDQSSPTITALADGRFVVSWVDTSQTGGDTSGSAIRAQILNADGSASGDEFLVNTTTSGFQGRPAVAAPDGGGFAIGWQDSNTSDIRAQVYDAEGNPSGNEFLVNTATLAVDPTVTALADGGFVISWADGDIRAQICDASGNAVGTAAFLVDTTTSGDQSAPSIAALTNGGFVVTWQDASTTGGDTDGTATRAQIFHADGGVSGGEFLVNTTTAGAQFAPAVVGLADGRFVVAWQDDSNTGGDTDGSAIRAQIFNADGTKSGGELLVNTTTAAGQTLPSVTALSDGGFVVTWADLSQSGDDTFGLLRGRDATVSGTKRD